MTLRSVLFSLSMLTAPAAALAADVPATKNTTATLTVNGASKLGLFETAGDSDWYKVRLTKDLAYAVVIDSGAPFNAVDPGILGAVRNSNGRSLKSAIDDPLTVGGFTFIAGYTGTHLIEYRHLSGTPLPTGYEARISTDCTGNRRTSCTLSLGTERRSVFNYAEDTDWFKVSLTRSRSYTLYGAGETGFYVGLYSATGELLWTDFLDESTRGFRPPGDGVYFIAAQGGDDYDYSYRLLLRTP